MIVESVLISKGIKHKTIKNFDKVLFVKISKYLILFITVILIVFYGSKIKTSFLETLSNKDVATLKIISTQQKLVFRKKIFQHN